MAYGNTNLRRGIKDASLAMAVRAAKAAGKSHQHALTQSDIDRMMTKKWRRDRLRDFNESPEKRIAVELHKPDQQSLILARMRREAEAATWIARVKARKAVKQ